MLKYRPLYIWWIFLLLIATSIFWSGYHGFISDIWLKDVTYATSLISAIFVYGVSIMCYIAWYISNIENREPIKHLIRRVWFLSEIEMGIAIIGTSLGLILLFNVNSGINVGDPAALQILVTHLWSTLGVAFYPNALGLITAVILKLMVFFITEEKNIGTI